jgi:hypothetical protein
VDPDRWLHRLFVLHHGFAEVLDIVHRREDITLGVRMTIRSIFISNRNHQAVNVIQEFQSLFHGDDYPRLLQPSQDHRLQIPIA